VAETTPAVITHLFAYGAPLIGLAVFAVGRMLWQVGLSHHQSTGT